jgi:hypothetical protein
MASSWSTRRSTWSRDVTQKTYRFHIDELAQREKGMGDVISRDHLGMPSIVRIEIAHADDGWEVTLVLDVD